MKKVVLALMLVCFPFHIVAEEPTKDERIICLYFGWNIFSGTNYIVGVSPEFFILGDVLSLCMEAEIWFPEQAETIGLPYFNLAWTCLIHPLKSIDRYIFFDPYIGIEPLGLVRFGQFPVIAGFNFDLLGINFGLLGIKVEVKYSFFSTKYSFFSNLFPEYQESDGPYRVLKFGLYFRT